MKKLICMLAVVMCFAITGYAELSPTNRTAINQWMTTLKNTSDNQVLATLCANTKADLVESHAPGLQRAWALLKTMSVVRGTPKTVSEIVFIHEAALIEIGLAPINNDNEFHLYRKNFNSAITDQNISDAKNRYQEFTNSQKERVIRSYTNMCFAAKDYNGGFTAIQDVINNNPNCNYAIVDMYFKIGRTQGSYFAQQTATTFFNMAENDTLPYQCASYVQFMVGVMLRNSETDLVAFKNKLNIIRITYMNKLATEDGRTKWNMFVSVIDNTWKSL